MKQLVKQIENAEARFEVLELQMQHNEKDHKTILNEVRHNCAENTKRFDSLENKLDQLVARSESRQYKTLFWAFTFGSATIIGLLISHILS